MREVSRTASEVAIVLADITGSVPLYEELGDAAASRQVGDCLDRMRSIIGTENGTFIRSKGDDVLCSFAEAVAALRAVRQMLAQPPSGPLAIHAGVHFGPLIRTRGDAFGDAVNLTARLAALAKPGEVLVSRRFVDQLPEADTKSLRALDNITFKGKRTQTEVFSLMEDFAQPRTEIGFARPEAQGDGADVQVTLKLRYADRSHSCGDRSTLSIGRSADCDLVIERPWVSRNHAVITVRRGKVQLDDRSSTGTYVSVRDGFEFFMRREIVLLTGSGTISPAVRPTDASAAIIHYEVIRHRRGKKS